MAPLIRNLLIRIPLLALLSSPGIVFAASFLDNFVDPVDGKLDASRWLSQKSGFLPVPLIISEPAVGYGAGLALAFLHDPADGESQPNDPNAMLHLPPSISVGVAAYTENDSWLAGGGHIASWKKDTVRYTGLAGYADLNLKFYGVAEDVNPDDLALGFNIKGFFLLQELVFRVGQSNIFVGGRYTYLTSDIAFTSFDDILDAPAIEFDSSTGGLGVIAKYDTRDNIVSPNSGQYAKLEPMFYDEALGGDFNYSKTKLSHYSYWPLSSVVLGVRLEGDLSHGDVPFYDAPYIEMRGIPALRYQGEDVLLAEVEARWDIDFRWSLVGFAGHGWTADSIGGIRGGEQATAGGIGFRYLGARRYGLRMGLDIARGPEDTVVYLAVGSNWN